MNHDSENQCLQIPQSSFSSRCRKLTGIRWTVSTSYNEPPAWIDGIRRSSSETISSRKGILLSISSLQATVASTTIAILSIPNLCGTEQLFSVGIKLIRVSTSLCSNSIYAMHIFHLIKMHERCNNAIRSNTESCRGTNNPLIIFYPERASTHTTTLKLWRFTITISPFLFWLADAADTFCFLSEPSVSCLTSLGVLVTSLRC